MRQELLTTEIVTGDGYVTICLTGEIDMSNAHAVRDAAICAMRQHKTSIRIDLAGVTFMDSIGLEALLATRRRAELDWGQVRLVAPTHAVLRILEVSGLDRIFRIESRAPSAAVRADVDPTQAVGLLP